MILRWLSAGADDRPARDLALRPDGHAYDAPAIHEFSRRLGHVPIIDPNPRRGPLIPLAPAEQRASGNGARRSASIASCTTTTVRGFVRVRGAAKVMTHLMFGVIALTATHCILWSI